MAHQSLLSLLRALWTWFAELFCRKVSVEPAPILPCSMVPSTLVRSKVQPQITDIAPALYAQSPYQHVVASRGSDKSKAVRRPSIAMRGGVVRASAFRNAKAIAQARAEALEAKSTKTPSELTVSSPSAGPDICMQDWSSVSLPIVHPPVPTMLEMSPSRHGADSNTSVEQSDWSVTFENLLVTVLSPGSPVQDSFVLATQTHHSLNIADYLTQAPVAAPIIHVTKPNTEALPTSQAPFAHFNTIGAYNLSPAVSERFWDAPTTTSFNAVALPDSGAASTNGAPRIHRASRSDAIAVQYADIFDVAAYARRASQPHTLVNPARNSLVPALPRAGVADLTAYTDKPASAPPLTPPRDQYRSNAFSRTTASTTPSTIVLALTAGSPRRPPACHSPATALTLKRAGTPRSNASRAPFCECPVGQPLAALPPTTLNRTRSNSARERVWCTFADVSSHAWSEADFLDVFG